MTFLAISLLAHGGAFVIGGALFGGRADEVHLPQLDLSAVELVFEAKAAEVDREVVRDNDDRHQSSTRQEDIADAVEPPIPDMPRMDMPQLVAPQEKVPSSAAPRAKGERFDRQAPPLEVPMEALSQQESKPESERTEARVVAAAKMETSLHPRYPRSCRERGIEGTVELLIDVSDMGIVKDVKVVRSSGNDDLDRAAVEAMRKAHFSPAKDENSHSVGSQVYLPVIFRLR